MLRFKLAVRLYHPLNLNLSSTEPPPNLGIPSTQPLHSLRIRPSVFRFLRYNRDARAKRAMETSEDQG